MNATRILGALCASILASSLGFGAVACGTPTESEEAKTAKTVSAASVSIQLYDKNNVRIGDGTGLLLAPRLVVTSGHLIAGAYKWVVIGADGKAKVTGSRGMTYDWQKYDSAKAHPRRHDVGVIHLDDAIKLEAYPKLVTEKLADNAAATRIRGTGAAFATADATLTRYKSSPNAWLTEMNNETLDTGGAVYDSRGVVGIVSGRGMTTGKLYVAKVDVLAKWLAPKVLCAGGVNVRTYAAGTPKDVICDEAAKKAAAGGSGSTTAGSGDSPSNSTAASADQPYPTNSCDSNLDGICFGGLCGMLGSPTKPGDEGVGSPTNPTTVPGTEGQGSPSTGSNTSTSNTNTTQAGPNAGGAGGIFGIGGSYTNTSYTNKIATPPNGGWTTTTVPGTEGQGSPSGNVSGPNTNKVEGPGNTVPPGTENGGGAGGIVNSPGYDGVGSGSDADVCQGANDNPDLCPPEPDGCAGSACGGGSPDDAIDYGGMSAGGGTNTTGGVDLR